MATLSIRNLPDDVHARLRLRAARAGHSMEAEARQILTEACAEPPPELDSADLAAFVDELYGREKPSGVVDELIAERRREAEGE
jgi:plasmid stability protein